MLVLSSYIWLFIIGMKRASMISQSVLYPWHNHPPMYYPVISTSSPWIYCRDAQMSGHCRTTWVGTSSYFVLPSHSCYLYLYIITLCTFSLISACSTRATYKKNSSRWICLSFNLITTSIDSGTGSYSLVMEPRS